MLFRLCKLLLLFAPSVLSTLVDVDLISVNLSHGCTYDVYLRVPSNQQTYAIYGDSRNTMRVPPSYQYPAPFGTDVGRPDSYFMNQIPDLEMDSYLTIGDIDNARLDAVGMDFDSWIDTSPLVVSDGAVFVIDPDGSPRGRVRVARLTVSQTDTMTFNAQGQTYTDGTGHYDQLRQRQSTWKKNLSAELPCENAH